MPVIRLGNNLTTTLAADVTAAATSITVASAAGFPPLTAPAGAVAPVTPILVGTEIMYVTAVSGTTLTVQRAQEGTTAGTFTTGTSVYQVFTRDAAYYNPAPAAVGRVTLTATYTPDPTFKYHFLDSGAVNTTIATPAVTAGSGMPAPQKGDELRFYITQGATARTITFTSAGSTTGTGYFGFTNPAVTANTQSSQSFAFNGTTWVRIQ